MNIKNTVLGLLIIAGLVMFGCTAAEETSENPKRETPPPVVQKPPERQPAAQPAQPTKTDTVSVSTQVTPDENTKPAVTPESTTAKTQPVQPPSVAPTGNFTVQVGAFSLKDKANSVTELAKQRFGKKVYTFQAKDTGLFKVTVGEFMTKDEGRKFRDQIVQQFPDDYKDAWVAPIPNEK